MKKPSFCFLIVSIMCYSTLTQAQSSMHREAPPVMPSGIEKNTTLESRFMQCMNNASCSTQTRMQIMQEENDEMNLHFQKIHQACADKNFQNCIDPQREDVQKWQTAHSHMQQMMQSMTAPSLENKSPAAGGPMYDEKKNIWNKIWSDRD